MLKRILKSAGSDALKYFPVRLVPALTSLITVPVFTRMVDKADYGNFYLISSATSLAATLATAWITGSVVRFYWTYRKQDRLDDYISTTLWSTVSSIVVVGIVLAALAYGTQGSLPKGLLRLVPVGIASLAVNYFITVLLQVLRAANRATSYAILSVASTIIGTAFSIFFVAVAKMGSFGILMGIVVGNAILFPLAYKQLRAEGDLSPSGFSRDILSEFLTYGMPLVPAAVSSWLLVLADRYVIGFVRSSAEVGLYSVAYGLGDKIMALFTLPLLTTMGPVMIQTFEQQGKVLAQQVQTQFTRYFSMATLPLLFGMAAVARHFMTVFTGPQYRVAYPVLPIVAAGSLAYGLVQIAGNGVALYKKSTILMTNTLIAAAFNVATNLMFVPRFGYMAAAYNTVASYVVLLGLTWWRSRPYIAWVIPWGDVARMLAACLAMWAAIAAVFGRLSPTPLLLLAEALFGAIVYFIGLIVLRELRDDERAFVRELGHKAIARLKGGRA